MTRFRIVERTDGLGKKTWLVQQHRFFLYWSSTYFWVNGTASYSSTYRSFDDAQEAVAMRTRDTLQKRAARPWNTISTAVKETSI